MSYNLSRTSYANSTKTFRFTAGEADILRRAMGKKKRAELEKQNKDLSKVRKRKV